MLAGCLGVLYLSVHCRFVATRLLLAGWASQDTSHPEGQGRRWQGRHRVFHHLAGTPPDEAPLPEVADEEDPLDVLFEVDDTLRDRLLSAVPEVADKVRNETYRALREFKPNERRVWPEPKPTRLPIGSAAKIRKMIRRVQKGLQPCSPNDFPPDPPDVSKEITVARNGAPRRAGLASKQAQACPKNPHPQIHLPCRWIAEAILLDTKDKAWHGPRPVWFGLLWQALELQDFDKAVEAQRQLSRLGVAFRFTRLPAIEKMPTQEVAHAS
jgi:hypothetical protein